MKLAFLLFSFACATGRMPERPRITDYNAKRVHEVREYGSRLTWIQEPWYDTLKDFLDWPRRIVIADDGTACTFANPPVMVPEPHTAFACPDAWRFPRNR